MRKKAGITLVSLVVYIMLLFGIVALSTSIASGFSTNILNEKGIATNMANELKLIANLNGSALNSQTATLNDMSSITFSNGDTYSFDANLGNVYKNGGILTNSVTAFSIEKTSEIPSENIEEYTVNLTLARYNSEMQRIIVFMVGE